MGMLSKMGTSASAQPVTGVKANPRVVYNEEISKKDKKSYILDAPVLVDVQHGSVRYRYGKYEGEPGNKARRIERPFEGEDRVDKQHYFYHARLNDFSEKASSDKEEPNKFMMVTKGPNSAHNKKLFYVYGIGLNAADGKRTMPTLSKEEGTDYAWPQTRKPNDVYYNLSFDPQDKELTEGTIDEERLEHDLSSTADRSCIQFTLCDEDNVHEIKKRLTYKILKSPENIHICLQKQELRDEDNIGDLRREVEGHWKHFKVTLNLI